MMRVKVLGIWIWHSMGQNIYKIGGQGFPIGFVDNYLNTILQISRGLQ